MSAPDAPQQVPVTLLTGFLGSGKTTLLNHLLRQPDLDGTVAIINEFGAVGLDHLLVEASEEQFALLDNGCVCCTIRGDLVETLRGLVAKRDAGALPGFRRVVIETTGLADPAPILHTLMADPALSGLFRVDAVIATIDAVNGSATLIAHKEAIKQAAVADRLLITKTDLARPEATARLRRSLVALNPTAEITLCRDGAIEARRLLDVGLFDPAARAIDLTDWFRQASLAAEREERTVLAGAEDCGEAGCDHIKHGLRYRDASHDSAIRTYAFVIAQPVSWAAFSQWLDYLAALKGEDLLRFKGLVQITEQPDRPLVVHGVQHVFHPPRALDAWPSEDRRTRLVFIVRNIPRAIIETTLAKFGAVDASSLHRPAA